MKKKYEIWRGFVAAVRRRHEWRFYLPDLVVTDFLLSPNMKEHLAVSTIADDSVETAWVGVPKVTPKETFAGGFQRSQNRFKKYDIIERSYADKI